MINRSLLFLALVGMVLFATSTSQAATLVVDDDGMAAVGNCNATTPAYLTISQAVAAANNGDTIRVCPGTYADNVIVNKSLRIRGAQAGNFYAGRTFAGPNESTVTGITPNGGVFSVEAPHVTIDGFSVTNPGKGLGIIVKTPGDNALIINNIVDTVGGTTLNDNTVGIYLELGPDRVKVLANWIRNVISIPTAQGILIGDSTSANPSLDILLVGNLIEDIRSVSRGAYGIQVNNGARPSPANGFTTVAILCNTIDNLNGGGWEHAIGLEGDTPGAIVRGNTVSNLIAGTANRVAVFVEDNPSFATVHVNLNNFNVTNTAFGIFVVPVPATSTASLDGTRNWWDSSTGPTHPANPGGSGALVSNNVNYRPWLRSPAQVCAGANAGHDDGDDNDDRDDRHDGDNDGRRDN
jgi:nitrous oxidase accessory protein NosD